jgi:NodT family efflux transporter outer membrane factor (OMF) lipoprotein
MCRRPVPDLLVRWLALGAVLPISGCLLGPNYVRPATPEPAAWHEPLGNALSSAPVDRDELATWWTVLGDPLLSDLVSRTLAGNLDLRAARERVEQAREHRAVAQANLWPTLQARVVLGPESSPQGSSKVSTGLALSWIPDLFGKLRRGVEASLGDQAASEEALHDALVNVAAEVVQSYVDVRSFQAQLALSEANLAVQTEVADLASWRTQAGLTTLLDVQRAQTDVSQTRAQIPSLHAGLEEAKNRLAMLMGETPGALAEELDATRPIPTAPAEIAIGVPADALERRPDVRRAERQLAAETARVGVAKAGAYPSISLSGAVGTGVIAPSTFTNPASLGAAAAAQIVQVLFDHGAIRATIKGQQAVRSESVARFQSTVLAALDDVENAIVEYTEEQNRERGLAEASAFAASAAELSRERYAAGLIDFLVVLDAERSLYSIEGQRVSSEGRVASDLVRLYRSLGGGWSTKG